MGKKILFCVFFLLLIIFTANGCSTKDEITYNISGTWQFTLTRSGGTTDTINLIFMGTVVSGTVTDLTRGYSGTYSVNSTTVNITFTFDAGSLCGDLTEMFNGSFTSPNTMSGTYDFSFTGNCGQKDPWTTWQATQL